MSDLTSVTHIAGADVTIGERRLRQRCSWCGAVLMDHDLANVSVQVDRCASCKLSA